MFAAEIDFLIGFCLIVFKSNKIYTNLTFWRLFNLGLKKLIATIIHK